MPRGIRSLLILSKPTNPFPLPRVTNPAAKISVISRKMELISFLLDIIQGGVFLSLLLCTILSAAFTPWMHDNMLPNNPSFNFTGSSYLTTDQILTEPKDSLSFSRGGVITINWVTNGIVDFYIFDESNFHRFQEWEDRISENYFGLFSFKGESNLTTNIEVSVTSRYYLVWHNSYTTSSLNFKSNISRLLVNFSVHFPPSAKIVLSPFVIFFLVFLICYLLIFFLVSLRKHVLSPIAKECLHQVTIFEKKSTPQPQICSHCYRIILVSEKSCSQCGCPRIDE